MASSPIAPQSERWYKNSPERAEDPQGTRSSCLQNGATEQGGAGTGLARAIQFEALAASGLELQSELWDPPQFPLGSAGGFAGPYLVRGSPSPAGMLCWEFLLRESRLAFLGCLPARPRREDQPRPRGSGYRERGVPGLDWSQPCLDFLLWPECVCMWQEEVCVGERQR